MKKGQVPWTREQTILAFELYCRTPPGQDKADNPALIALAKALRRSPQALRFKLQNFKSLDPAYTQAGRVGMKNVTRLDKSIAAEFYQDWAGMACEAEAIRQRLGIASEQEISLDAIPELSETYGKDIKAERNIRIGQGFFRGVLLACYRGRCAITGISTPALLRASHIKPWAKSSANEKANPRNGILLNALCDAAFDNGYISFDEDCRLMLSADLLSGADAEAKQIFLPYNGQKLNLPERFPPDKTFLRYHRETIFNKGRAQ